MVQAWPDTESQFDQAPKVEEPVGVAVNVTGVPLAKLVLQFVEQPRPGGELFTIPAPLPANCTERIGPAPPAPPPVKHTTLAVIYPVTMAPDEL